MLYQVVSGNSSPIEAKRLSNTFPYDETPDDVLMATVPDTLLQHREEFKPALRELISLAQACMGVAQSERPDIGSHGETEGTIVGCLS